MVIIKVSVVIRQKLKEIVTPRFKKPKNPEVRFLGFLGFFKNLKA